MRRFGVATALVALPRVVAARAGSYTVGMKYAAPNIGDELRLTTLFLAFRD